MAIVERFLRCDCVLTGVPHLLLRVAAEDRAARVRAAASSLVAKHRPTPSSSFAMRRTANSLGFADAGDVRFAEVCAICLRAVLVASSGPLDAQDRPHHSHLLCSRHGRLLRLDAGMWRRSFVEAALALDASGGTPTRWAFETRPCGGQSGRCVL